MPIESYVTGKIIGKGSHGQVSLARHKKDKKQYVIKKIDLQSASPKERNFAQQEVDILSKLRHPNIVSYKESFQDHEGFLYIVMGYCESGDLYTKLKEQAKKGEFLTEKQIVEWFVQIAMALQYMHDKNILHRDLKTQNIFLTRSKIIKIGDLGIARILDNTSDMATTLIGTPYYMSPELFSNKPYNHKSDIWALGCCVYEMATLKHAFNAKDMNALVYKILKGKTPAMPKHYSQELCDIIKNMMSYNPVERPSASRILRHSFIKKHIALFLEGTKARKKQKEDKEKSTSRPISGTDSGYGDSGESQAMATASAIDVEIIDEDRQEKYIVKESGDSETKENKKERISDREEKHVNKKPSKDVVNEEKVPRKEHSEMVDEKPVVKKSVSDKSSKKVHKQSKDENSRERHRSKERVNSEEKSENIVSKDSEEQPKKAHTPRKEHRKIRESKDHEPVEEKEEIVGERSHSRQRRRSGPNSPNPFEKPVPVKDRRPLPPKPIEDDHKKHGRQRSSTDPEQRHASPSPANPKCSAGVPNISARQKRRQRQKEEGYVPPQLPRRSTDTSISSPGSRPSSGSPRITKEQVTRQQSGGSSRSASSVDVVDGRPHCQSQSSVSGEESSGSELEEVKSSGDRSVKDQPSSGRVKKSDDMGYLIDAMQQTLKVRPTSSSERSSPEDSVDTSQEPDAADGPASPSTSGRLSDRIERLRRECLNGVGERVLRDAYRILDEVDDDRVEDALVKLMGREKIEIYGGQIWQLKFCEEFRR